MGHRYVPVHIRWMIRRDMPVVRGIERDSFEFAWDEEDFLHCLRQRNCIGMVAERWDEDKINGQVVGYMLYELFKTRMHVINFAVHPAHRRLGVGRQLVTKLAGKLYSHRRRALTWHVCEYNVGCQLFLRNVRLGLKAVRCVPDMYPVGPPGGIAFELRNHQYEGVTC